MRGLWITKKVVKVFWNKLFQHYNPSCSHDMRYVSSEQCDEHQHFDSELCFTSFWPFFPPLSLSLSLSLPHTHTHIYVYIYIYIYIHILLMQYTPNEYPCDHKKLLYPVMWRSVIWITSTKQHWITLQKADMRSKDTIKSAVFLNRKANTPST